MEFEAVAIAIDFVIIDGEGKYDDIYNNVGDNTTTRSVQTYYALTHTLVSIHWMVDWIEASSCDIESRSKTTNIYFL